VVLQEEWDRVAIEEINALFQRLPTVMQRCIAVDGVITFFMVKIFCNFLGTGFNSVLFPYHCIPLLPSFTTSPESSYLDHYWWTTGGFCVGGGSERLHKLSLGTKIVGCDFSAVRIIVG